MSNEKYIDKIRALMNKTTAAGCTPEEAEAAAAMAAKLMEQYHINNEQVVGKKDANKQGTVDIKYGYIQPWTTSLVAAVGKMTGCFVLTSQKHAYFFGTETAVDAAVFMANNLQERVAKMAFEYWNKVKDTYSPHDKSNTVRNYRLGLAHGIHRRLAQQRENTNKEALLVVDNAVIKAQEFASTITAWRASRRSVFGPIGDESAYYNGVKDAADVAVQQRLN